VLKAPYDGIVGNRSVQEGDLVSPGQRLMALVPVRQLYIDANFKETQIQHLVPGSKVNVQVDAYSDHPIVGTVESISPASSKREAATRRMRMSAVGRAIWFIESHFESDISLE
ncbi:HlyD family secretion protein, partial [Rhizobium ruizarguesonis]